MNEMTVIAPVRKTVRVKAPIAHAFDVFTGGLTRWWPFDHGVGKKPIAKVLMEPRLGGRWLEISQDGAERLAAGLPVSRPAVSQHLKVLKDAGLVEERSEGVRRIYSLRREGLLELREWLDSFWGDALEAFRLEAEKSHGAKVNKRSS